MSLIYLHHKQKEELREKFHVSASAVSFALRFRGNSMLSREIRVYAVNQLNGYVI